MLLWAGIAAVRGVGFFGKSVVLGTTCSCLHASKKWPLRRIDADRRLVGIVDSERKAALDWRLSDAELWGVFFSILNLKESYAETPSRHEVKSFYVHKFSWESSQSAGRWLLFHY